MAAQSSSRPTHGKRPAGPPAQQPPWPAWDPMRESFLQLQPSVAPKIHDPIPLQRRIGARSTTWLFVLRTKWLDVAYWMLTAALLIAGSTILGTSWPWSVTDGADYSTTVASAAASLAFGATIISTLALPIATAAQFGPGHTAEISFRKLPWVPGIVMILMSALLFTISALRPDRESAIASGLIATGGFSLVWIISRHTMFSADSLAAAERQADFIRRNVMTGVRQQRSVARRLLPRDQRNDANIRALCAKGERDLVAGFLRHAAEGARGAMANGATWAAFKYWQASSACFLEYARDVKGAIGPSTGLPAVLFDIADTAANAFLKSDSDLAAVRLVQSLEELCTEPLPTFDYSAIRSKGLFCLNRWIQRTRDLDDSYVPAECVSVIGRLAQRYAELGAYSDASRLYGELARIAGSSYKGGRVHILRPAVDAITSTLTGIATVPTLENRQFLLRAWAKAIRRCMLFPTPPATSMLFGCLDSALPGISVESRDGLQLRIWRSTAGDQAAGRDVLVTLFRTLENVSPHLAKQSIHQPPMERPFVDALAIVYCTILCSSVRLGRGTAVSRKAAALAQSIVRSSLRRLEAEERATLFQDTDVLEMIWSCLLAACQLANRSSHSRKFARRLLGLVGPQETMELLRSRDVYKREFISGVLIVTGASDDEIDRRFKEATGGVWRRSGRTIDLRPASFGRAPSVNQNRVLVEQQAEHNPIDDLNFWSVGAFPRFRA